jgi:hypothetical protein
LTKQKFFDSLIIQPGRERVKEEALMEARYDLLAQLTNRDEFFDSELAIRLMFPPNLPGGAMCITPVVARIWQNEGLVVTAKVFEMNPVLGCWMQAIFTVDVGPAVRLISRREDRQRYVEEICLAIKQMIEMQAFLKEWPLITGPEFKRGSLADGAESVKLSVSLNWSNHFVHPGNVFEFWGHLTRLIRDKVMAIEAPVNLTHYTELEDRPSLAPYD